MSDYALPVRRAILPRLKAVGALTQFVPAASIYPSTVPANRTLPFIRYGVPTVTPFRATGLDSSQFRIAISAFTLAKMIGSAPVMTAEDVAYEIGAVVKEALDGATLDIGSGLKVRLTWLSTVPRADPDEKDAWATTVTFQAEVAG